MNRLCGTPQGCGSADFQSAVSPISNRLGMDSSPRVSTGRTSAGWKPCDTAGWKPALPLINSRHPFGIGNRPGFTLIELLVVIAIIGILAAMVLGLMPLAARAKVNNRVKAEMAQVQSAIESYKEKRGFYPPDNVKNPGTNSLYYELSGTVLEDSPAPPHYRTLDGIVVLPVSSVAPVFNVAGFINSNSKSPSGADDAKNFHPALKMGTQVKDMNVNGTQVKLLGVSVNGPSGSFCPWVYNSSAPTHNPNGYDLWVDATVNGKTRRFGNWKDD